MTRWHPNEDAFHSLPLGVTLPFPNLVIPSPSRTFRPPIPTKNWKPDRKREISHRTTTTSPRPLGSERRALLDLLTSSQPVSFYSCWLIPVMSNARTSGDSARPRRQPQGESLPVYCRNISAISMLNDVQAPETLPIPRLPSTSLPYSAPTVNASAKLSSTVLLSRKLHLPGPDLGVPSERLRRSKWRSSSREMSGTRS